MTTDELSAADSGDHGRETTRAPCQHCGFCEFFGGESGAKSSTLATTIRAAERTGVCEIRPNSHVHRVEHDARGRVIGVAYFDSARRERVRGSPGRRRKSF